MNSTPDASTNELHHLMDKYSVDFRAISQGHYGTVHRCIHRETEECFALKCINKSQVRNINVLRRDMAILKNINHPNIIKVFEIYEDEEYMIVITEFCTGGQLFDKIGQLSERDIANIILCILDALSYCHDTKNIIHRDLKAESFLFKVNEDNASIKIIDFGLAPHDKQNFGVVKTARGMPYYTAPETLETAYFKSSDIWSIGVIAYTLLCGYPPFHGDSEDQIIESVKTGHLNFPSPDWDGISDTAKDFVSSLLKKDKAKRLTASEALQHNWLNIESSMSSKPVTKISHSSDHSLTFKKTIALQKVRKALRHFDETLFSRTELQSLQDAICKIEVYGNNTKLMKGESTAEETKTELEEVHESEVLALCNRKFDEIDLKFKKMNDHQAFFGELIFSILSRRNETTKTERDTNLQFQDTYTFMMLPFFSFPSLVAWIIFILQIGCIFLAVSEFFFTPNFNFQIQQLPKGVDRHVHAAQGLSILLILLLLEALWESTSALYYLFHASITIEGTNLQKWMLSHFMRLFEAISATFATFTLVLYSDNVVDLFKDFTAIMFISAFDNIAFILAGLNLFGPKIKKSLDRVNEIKIQFVRYSVSSDFEGKCVWFHFRRLLFHPYFFGVLLMVTMYTSWIKFVVEPQIHGKFLCQQFYIQLDDEINPSLSYLSGSYKLLKGAEKRVWYPAYKEEKKYEKRSGKEEKDLLLYYCEETKSWVFTLEEKEYYAGGCNVEKTLVRSSDNVENEQKYDLHQVSDSDWSVKEVISGIWMPLKDVVIDCEDEGSKYEEEQDDFCDFIEIDEREDPFESSRSWSKNFTIMKQDSGNITKLYGHPVFRTNKTDDEGEFELVLYLGKRWSIMYSEDLTDYKEMKKRNRTVNLPSYFETHFHPYWSNFSVAFFSEPVRSDTTKDKMIPVGLSWVMASPKISGQKQLAEDNRKVPSIFLCGNCNNSTNPCFYEGTCHVNRTCECKHGSTGALCQVLPTNNGYCNEAFNKLEFDFDGGDCCEHSCVSSETFKCGRDESGLFYVGYDSCHVDDCFDCWMLSSLNLNMKDLVMTYVSLSSSGQVLGLIESVGKTARVYDNDGSAWVMRGSPVMTIYEPSSSIIEVIGREDILSNKGFYSPITVVIKSKREVHVFDWNNNVWTECDNSIFNTKSSSPMHLHLKNYGNSLGIQYDDYSFRLFERDHSSLPWKDSSFKLNSSDKYQFGSLSKNGMKVALANDNCVAMHDLLNNITNNNCNLHKSLEIKQVAFSEDGEHLGILFERETQGEVVVFHVENNMFLDMENVLRGVSVGNCYIALFDYGDTVTSYCNRYNLFEIYQFLNDAWKNTYTFPSQGFSLSSNRKVMINVSPTSGNAEIYHRTDFCDDGFSNVKLSFITDNHPNELLWELLNITASGEVRILKRGGPYESAQTLIVEEMCIDNNIINIETEINSTSCIGLRVIDLGLDGLKSPGRIGISINGTTKLNRDDTDGYDNIYRVVGRTNCSIAKKDITWPQKYSPALHAECFNVDCVWEKIGSVKRSSFEYDRDSFLSISADGRTVSVGDFRTNQVQILTYNSHNQEWTPYGSTITRQNENEWFGFSTSLSADGSKVAIGDPRSNATGTHSGQVHFYSYNETVQNWIQYGNTINGSRAYAQLGHDVSMSADGTVLAAGTYFTSPHTCTVYVYEYSSMTDEWILRGQCLSDERFNSTTNVTLSSTGYILVVGSLDVKGTDEICKYGLVKVFEYNSFTREWNQLGTDIEGDGYYHELGGSLAISSDGSVLALAGWTSFFAKAYLFNKEENNWEQIGQNISLPYVKFYADVSLSADGSVWAISHENRIQVFIYSRATNEWKESITSFPTINFTHWHSLSVSSADVVTVATKGNCFVELYNLTKKSVSNRDCEGNLFNFTIQPDRFPMDINWFLQDKKSEILIGGTLSSDDIFNYNECLSNESSPFLFYIEDEYGDGICCDFGNGHFALKWDNETVMDHTGFKSKNGTCLPQSSDLVLVSLNVPNFENGMDLLILDSNGKIMLSRSGIAGENITFDQCFPTNECYSLVMFNVEKVLLASWNGDRKETFNSSTTGLEIFDKGDCEKPSCPQNHSLFKAYFVTDDWPREFSWELLDLNNKTLMDGGNYKLEYKIIHYQECVAVPQNGCATLILKDECNDGEIYYDIFWNGNEIANGTLYTKLEFKMGSCAGDN